MTQIPPLGRRTAAISIDFVIFSSLSFAYIRHFGEVTDQGSIQLSGCLPFLGLYGLWLVLTALPEALFGASVGKALLDLRVVSDEGGRPGVFEAIQRHLLDWLEVLGPGWVLASRPPEGRRLGDQLAKTRVVSLIHSPENARISGGAA